MIVHTNFEQGSLEWLNARAGKITASEMHRLVTPLGKVRVGDGPKTMLLEKLAEKWMGAPLPNDASSFMMEQGALLEEFARPAFELETGLKIKQVALIETDDGRCACSPDGIVEGKDIGLEIKSPGIVNHIRYLLDNKLPDDYVLQVQGCLWVTGFSKWMFTSFRRRMPPLVLTIEPDDKIQEAITEAVEHMLESMDAAWETLCKLNGGPPPKKDAFVPTPGKPQFTWEMQDDVPH